MNNISSGFPIDQNRLEQNGSYLNEPGQKENKKTVALFRRILNGEYSLNKSEQELIYKLDKNIFTKKDFQSFTDDERASLIKLSTTISQIYTLPLDEYILETIQKYRLNSESCETKQFLIRAKEVTTIPEKLFIVLKQENQILDLLKCCPNLLITVNIECSNGQNDEPIPHTISAKMVMEMEYFTALLRNINNVKETIGYEKEKSVLYLPITYNNEEEKERYTAFFQLLQDPERELKNIFNGKQNSDTMKKLSLITQAADYFILKKNSNPLKGYIEKHLFEPFNVEFALDIFHEIASEREKEFFSRFEQEVFTENLFLRCLLDKEKLIRVYLNSRHQTSNNNTPEEIAIRTPIDIFSSSEIIILGFIKIYKELEKNPQKIKEILIKTLSLIKEKGQMHIIRSIADIDEIVKRIPDLLPELHKNKDFIKNMLLIFKEKGLAFFSNAKESVKAEIRNDEEILQYFFGPKSEENDFSYLTLQQLEMESRSNIKPSRDDLLRELSDCKNRSLKECAIITYINNLPTEAWDNGGFVLKIILSAIPLSSYLKKIGNPAREKLIAVPAAIKKIVDLHPIADAIEILTGNPISEFTSAPLSIRNNIDITYKLLQFGHPLKDLERNVWADREFLRQVFVTGRFNFQDVPQDLQNDDDFMNLILTLQSDRSLNQPFLSPWQ